ncbi:MAG: outer membrane protein transport protein [Acinetobacter sp.]
MKLNQKKHLIAAMLSVFAGQSYAAGLERSPHQIDALFEQGTYAEIGYTHISPDVAGKDMSGNSIADIAEDFQLLNYAVKTDLSPSLRLAVIYDEPYGAKVKFEGGNSFVEPSLPAADAGTRVEVKSKNITALLGYSVNKNVMIYGGPALQELEADVHLRGAAYGAGNGYNNKFSDGMAAGWVAGVSYAKPEMGILASLTYRSEIEHKTSIHEDVPLADMLGLDYSPSNSSTVTTPESVNLNLQTGLNMTTAAFAKVRYVPWSDFEYRPPVLHLASEAALGAGKGLPLLNYAKDQTAVEIGLAKQVRPNLTLAVSGLWDSGAGNPVTTLGPVEGYWGAGLAAKYSINENAAFSLGGRFLWFGDAKGSVPDGSLVGGFQDNTGYIVGMKLSYSSK